MQTTWERMTDRRIQLNTIKNRAENMLQQYSHSLEERRDRSATIHNYNLYTVLNSNLLPILM